MAFQSRRKFCYFKENGITDINYKDVKLLKRFITEQCKIMPRRVTGTSSKMHRKLVRAIKPVSYTHLRAHETREDRVWPGVR